MLDPSPNPHRMLSLHPPLRACLGFSFRHLGWVLGGIVIVGIAIRWIRDRPFALPTLLFQLAVVYVCLAVLLALVLYAACRACAWSVGPGGLKGRDVWGRRVRIGFDDIGSIVISRPAGIPILAVASATAPREVQACLLGVDFTPVHVALVDLAGPEHALTQAFSPRSD